MTPTNPGPWLIPGLSSRMIDLHALTGAKALTMGEIAQKLSFEFEIELTRNAVIGRCRRLGLAARPSPLPQKKLRSKPVRVDAPIAPVEAERLPEDNALTIYQLDSDTCKFFLGKIEDYPPYLYCGKQVLREGVPWCPEHYARCHVKARLEWE